MAYDSVADSQSDGRIEEAKQFLRLCNDSDSNNRAEALDDVRFAAGDQWPVDVQNSRVLEARPCLTINKVDAYIRQICNQQRQQRPAALTCDIAQSHTCPLYRHEWPVDSSEL